MGALSLDYKCYDPAEFSVSDIARLVVRANLWADCQRGLRKNFNQAVNSKQAWGAIREWVNGFNHAVGTPLFSSYVAISDNQPVGFVATGLDIWDETQRTGEIKSLAVAPDYWGHGIGARLLTAAELFLQEQQCRRITLWVEPENKRAFHLYKKEGWSHVEGVYHSQPVNGRMTSFYELEKHF